MDVEAYLGGIAPIPCSNMSRLRQFISNATKLAIKVYALVKLSDNIEKFNFYDKKFTEYNNSCLIEAEKFKELLLVRGVNTDYLSLISAGEKTKDEDFVNHNEEIKTSFFQKKILKSWIHVNGFSGPYNDTICSSS